jgi:hypothetical protein
MIAHWAEWTDPDGNAEPVEAPNADFVAHRHAMLERRGIGRMVH